MNHEASKIKNILQRVTKRIDRFYVHAAANRDLRQVAEQVKQHAPEIQPGTQPVIFFNASTRLSGLSQNAAFSLVSSWAVRMSGVPVLHYVCEHGMGRCVLGTKKDDVNALPPCAECMRQSRSTYHAARVRPLQFAEDPSLAAELETMSLERMMDLDVDGVPLGRLTLPALRWVLRRHTLSDELATRFLFSRFLLSAWWIVQDFGALLDEVNPQAVVVFNGQFFPEAAARYAAQQRGIRVISHEVALRPHTAYFTTGEATAYPIDIPAEFELNDAQNARLNEYLEQRFQGNFSMAGVRFWPQMQPLSAEFWQRAEKYSQIVPIFTNVIFDTSQGHANVLFSDMFAWLDAVLEIIRAHPDTFFVLRAHPDESRPGKASRETVADWARSRAVENLPNVLFVDSSEFFSSYELIQRSKFVMIYNSTIGLEASLMGAAVLCAGKARFTQLPTVFFPASAEEYLRLTQEFLSAQSITVPETHRRNARRFLYYQLFRTSLPFDAFLEDDGVWRGYVRIKPWNWQAFLPENSATLKTVVDGILRGGNFMMEEEV